MRVAEGVGRALAERHGVRVVFGLMGSGNLPVTNALRAGGARFVASRHEHGSVAMADAYVRVAGHPAVATTHQGPGLTNAVTALAEAAKARTPLVVVAADTPAHAVRSNFRIDQAALVASVGAVAERVHGPATALADVARAVHRARAERRTVVLMLPLDVQADELPEGVPPPFPELVRPRPAAAAIRAAAEVLAGAERPAIVAGRGAALAAAGPSLRRLGQRTGALLATSAAAHGLFAGDPFDLGIAGGFASPLAARLLRESDAILAVGAALNHWTTRHGELIHPDATVVQVDLDAAAVGAHRPAQVGVVGDATAAAEALISALDGRVPRGVVRRTDALAEDVAAYRWRAERFERGTTPGTLDPRELSIALDDLLPEARTVVVDSGHFMGWPAMYLRVPDAAGFVFTQAFQCVGLGLPNAVGAALARPDRLTVAAVGDGGLLLALPELETLGRLGVPLLVVVYDDAAYGAEVHHFRARGEPVDTARFPPTDFAALAEAAGCRGLTARSLRDLDGVRTWLAAPDRPLVLDAKVDPGVVAEWLQDAFRGS